LYTAPGVTENTFVCSRTSGNPPYLTKCLQIPVGGFIDVGTMGNFGSTMDDFSISTWIRSSYTAAHIAPLGALNSITTTRFMVQLNRPTGVGTANGCIRVTLWDDDNSRLLAGVNTDTGITDGDWHHLVININKSNGTVTIYIDNVSQPITYRFSGTGTNFSDFAENLSLGAFNNAGTHEDFLSPDRYNFGYLDDFRIMNRELTEAEIAFLYNDGDGTEELIEAGIARPLVGGSLAAGRRGLV